VSLQADVLAALGTVYDPELDEPITTLGFVGSCVVTSAGDVSGGGCVARARRAARG
jgi:metal-sulfur cluster biosynthetic enzyme